VHQAKAGTYSPLRIGADVLLQDAIHSWRSVRELRFSVGASPHGVAFHIRTFIHSVTATTG
jgi:hypothetical protein